MPSASKPVADDPLEPSLVWGEAPASSSGSESGPAEPPPPAPEPPAEVPKLGLEIPTKSGGRRLVGYGVSEDPADYPKVGIFVTPKGSVLDGRWVRTLPDSARPPTVHPDVWRSNSQKKRDAAIAEWEEMKAAYKAALKALAPSGGAAPGGCRAGWLG